MANKTYHYDTAFPQIQFYDEKPSDSTQGLTKCEYFAIKILQGLVANTNLNIKSAGAESDLIKKAVAMADALINELNQ